MLMIVQYFVVRAIRKRGGRSMKDKEISGFFKEISQQLYGAKCVIHGRN
jgi:hypothetical protein